MTRGSPLFRYSSRLINDEFTDLIAQFDPSLQQTDKSFSLNNLNKAINFLDFQQSENDPPFAGIFVNLNILYSVHKRYFHGCSSQCIIVFGVVLVLILASWLWRTEKNAFALSTATLRCRLTTCSSVIARECRPQQKN